jgi:hypothetical protein
LSPCFSKGEKAESFIEDIQQRSPPFGKGRPEGISEKAYLKS